MCIFPFKSVSGCTLYVIFSLFSSQKDLIFPVPPLSNKLLINYQSHCSWWSFAVMPCYVFTLPARWICWCYLVCLTHLISPIIYKLWVCLLCCLVGELAIWASAKTKENIAHSLSWSAWYNCMCRVIFEHGLSNTSFQFLTESSTLPLSTYWFSKLGHCTGGDKVFYKVFLCYKVLTGV